MKQYLKYRIWDWLLCVLISIGMAVNLLSGFLIDDVNQRLPFLVIVAAVVSAVCFLFALNRRTAVIGIIVAVVALAVAVVVCHGRQVLENDTENAGRIFWIVVVACTVAVFLAGRRRLGVFLLLLIGNVLQAGAAFLQFPVSLWAYVVFLAACAAMLLYRVYERAVLRSHTGKARFGGYMRQTACICLAALVLGGALYAGVVKPLNPPTHELKLIQRLKSFEVLQKVGVSQIHILLDDEKVAEEEPEEQITTDQQEEEGQDSPEESGTDATTQEDTGSRMTATQAEAAQAITYAAASYWYLWVILAAAVVAALILGKRRSRAVWLDRVDALNPGDGVQNLYRFYLLGLEKSGCRRGRSLTLDEYMCLNEKGIQKFDDGDSKAFGQLTPIYEKTCYGGQEISQEEYALVRGYYNGFHKKVRRAVGRFRYLFLYFRL